MSASEKGGAEVVALFIWSLLSLRPAVCRGSIQRSRGRFISWGDGSREATREALFVTITAMPKEYIFRPIYDHPRRGYSRRRENAKWYLRTINPPTTQTIR
jgi:hypothetical protein